MRKRFAATVAVGLFLIGSSDAHAKSAKRPHADFTLTISTEEGTVKAQRELDYLVVSVKKTNSSRHPVNVGRLVGEPGGWYAMRVLRDGVPAPQTDLYREMLSPRKLDPNEPVEFNTIFSILKPRQSQTFEVPLARYFDLSEPSQYEITFSRHSHPGEPDSVEVTSNTIYITVLPSDGSPASQGQK